MQILCHCTVSCKINFSKICLLAAFNCKMVSIKKIYLCLLTPNCTWNHVVTHMYFAARPNVSFHTFCIHLIPLNFCWSLTSAFLSGLLRASFNHHLWPPCVIEVENNWLEFSVHIQSTITDQFLLCKSQCKHFLLSHNLLLDTMSVIVCPK